MHGNVHPLLASFCFFLNCYYNTLCFERNIPVITSDRKAIVETTTQTMAGRVHSACYFRPVANTEGASFFGKTLSSEEKQERLEVSMQAGEKPLATQAYMLTPVFLGVAVALFFSYVGLWAHPEEKYVFSTVTNLCYIAAGLQREIAAHVEQHSVSYLIGLLGSAPYVLVLLGSASLAYHRHSRVGSWTHSLDIFFGMLLVYHVFYASASVVVLSAVGRCFHSDDKPRRAAAVQAGVRVVLAIGFATGIFCLMFWFEDFYANMLSFYLVFGPGAALFGIILRLILARDPTANYALKTKHVLIAAAEMSTLLLMVFAAIFSQCELIGVKYTINSNPAAYDFFHGQWHFLLAISMASLYSRAADAARRVRNPASQITVASLPWMDWIGLAIGFVYALLVIIFKESQVDLTTAKTTLGVFAGIYGLYGLVSLVAYRDSVWLNLGGACFGVRQSSAIAPEPSGEVSRV